MQTSEASGETAAPVRLADSASALLRPQHNSTTKCDRFNHASPGTVGVSVGSHAMNFLAAGGSALVILSGKCLKVPRGRNPRCGDAVVWRDRRGLMHCFEELPTGPLLAPREPHGPPPSGAVAFLSLSTNSHHARRSYGRGSAICLQIFTSDSATATQNLVGSRKRPWVNLGSPRALAHEFHEAYFDRSHRDPLLMEEGCRLFATSRATKTHKGI